MINEKSRELSLFLEKLRKDVKMSQDHFLDGIVSVRQFRRYASGESEMPFLVLEKLASRLGFRTDNIIFELDLEVQKQTDTVRSFYQAVARENKNLAKERLSLITPELLLRKNDRIYYKLAKILYDALIKVDPEWVTLDKMMSIVYEERLFERQNYLSSEIFVLVSLFKLKGFKDGHLVAERLVLYLENSVTVVNSKNHQIVILSLTELCRYYSGLENFEKMLYYAEEGIRYSMHNRSYYMIHGLFYYAAIASHFLNDIKKRDDYLFRGVSGLYMAEDKDMLDRFKILFEKRFDLDLNEFMRTYEHKGQS